MAEPTVRETDAAAELGEAIERFGSDLRQLLDRRGERAGLDPELLNGVFREAHSIKGLAGLFGEESLAAAAHAAEDLLDGLRLGQLALDDGLEALLDELPEGLASALAVAPGSEPQAGLVSRIGAALAAAQAAGGGPAVLGEAELALEPALRAQLTSYEEHRLAEVLSQGQALWGLRARIPLAELDRALRELRARAQLLGEVLATLPVPEELPADRLVCDLLFASSRPASEIEVGLHAPPPVAEGLAAAEVQIDLRLLRPARATVVEPRAAPTVRIELRTLDRMLETLSDLGVVRLNLTRVAAKLQLSGAPAPLIAEILQEARKLERRLDRMQAAAIDARMVPLGPIFTRLERMLRREAGELGKEVEIELQGGEVLVDKLLAESLSEPLVHLTRNALVHGLEAPEVRVGAGKPRAGRLSLRAAQRAGQVLVEVRDDGQGIDPLRVQAEARARGLPVSDPLDHRALVQLLLTPGFSTARGVSAVAGRGVGLDAVQAKVQDLSGFLEIHSDPGRGSTFVIALPATLAILRALIVRGQGQTFAVPTAAVSEIVAPNGQQLADMEWSPTPDGEPPAAAVEAGVPLAWLTELLGLGGEGGPRPLAVLVGPAGRRLGLLVDGLSGQRDLVAKPLGRALGPIFGVSGLAQLGPDQPILALDVAALLEAALGRSQARRTA